MSPKSTRLSLVVLVIVFFVSVSGCGGGGTTPTLPALGEITSVSITPAAVQLRTGDTQTFTAHVVGTGKYDSAVIWSVSGIVGGDVIHGTVASGLYTAPASLPTTNVVTLTATSVADPRKSANATITLNGSGLGSVAPNGASAGERVTIMGQDLMNPTGAYFSGPNGVTLKAAVESVSLSQVTAVVPFGTISGPVYLELVPEFNGPPVRTNSVSLTRLPNLRMHAPYNDISSGEMVQFSWDVLGANTPTEVDWTATSGTINPGGLYQAPVVLSEDFVRVTGCIRDTRSCDTVLLRILPLRITPYAPVVAGGNTVQLDAVQGGGPQTANWSVLSGGGTVSSGGLYTAPTDVSGAGTVPISATVGSTTQTSSVAVAGAFPGIVNRIYEYVDFNNFTNLSTEGAVSYAVATKGNRAYSADRSPLYFSGIPHASIEQYDISDPKQPVWMGGVESVISAPIHLFTYGNYLFEVDSGYLVPVPSKIAVYSIAGPKPALMEIRNLPDSAFTTVNDGIVYGLPLSFPNSTSSFPVYLADVRGGSPVVSQYALPVPPNNLPAEFFGISGVGNFVYVSWVNDVTMVPRLTIAKYDISTSPPRLVSTLLTDVGFKLQVVSPSLLFADYRIFDISGTTPVPIASIPMIGVQSVQGNRVLAWGTFGNYLVIDVTDPVAPVVFTDVADIPTLDIFNNPTAALAGDVFLATDGLGGIAVYDISTPGGPTDKKGVDVFRITFDQVVRQQTLYLAGEAPMGKGGLAALDLSGTNPTILGTLLYPDNAGFSLQVSGDNVFLGLSDSLKVVDASNPRSLVETASLAIPTNALALSGNVLFVGTADSRLVILDVSNPNSPQQIGSVALPGPPNTVRVSGTKVFVADGTSGLLIFDVSTPALPVRLSQFSPPSPVWDVAVIGTTALVAADESGMVAIDFSNPAQVKQLSSTPLPLVNAFPPYGTIAGINPALSISIQNGLAYVGTMEGFVLAYDVGQPATPRLMTLNLIGGFIFAINSLGSNLYLAADGTEVQMDNAAPFNSIQLFYPPISLSNPFPISSVVSSSPGAAGLRKAFKQRGITNAHFPGKGASSPGLADCTARQKAGTNSSNAPVVWDRLSLLNACRHLSSERRSGF